MQGRTAHRVRRGGVGREDEQGEAEHGVEQERIDALRLGSAWVYRSPVPPSPAWAGPARC
mgnify:CR=1 FL=1